MHPKNLRIEDYTYDLPEDRIAKFPLGRRDESKLLVYKKGVLSEDQYKNIASYIPRDSLLVFNNTKVVEARLLFQKATGGIIEIFALEPDDRYQDIVTAMQSSGQVFWKCLVGGASKWKHGVVLEKKVNYENELITLSAKIVDRQPGSFVIEFSWSPAQFSFAHLLHVMGSIPIPPYLKRESDLSDAERYQTIYAKEEGSVAAPTAGLHFTDHIFNQFTTKNIESAFVTLHVGAGTFMPVKTNTMAGHEMHAEFIDADAALIKKLSHASSIYCVGTTSLRSIESLYWMGVKCFINPSIAFDDIMISQWDVYDHLSEHACPKQQAFNSLLQWMEQQQINRLIIKTQILIAPGYASHLIKGLITNFHQPQSTLLLLVAAFIGNDWKKVYNYAKQNDFRFLSYGDGCLLEW